MVAADPSSLSPNEAVDSLLMRLPRPARLLVAVSGGSDSLGLLLALSQRRHEGVEVLAVTVDHRLRSESAFEALRVGAFCRDLGILHLVKNWEGEKPKAGIAAAARDARYRLLCEAADETDASLLLTGHTLDDQVETVTMRASRNEDPDTPGLAGMAEAVLLNRRHWLVRPFLHSRRADIRDFLQGLGQEWIDDPSNLDMRSERVRTRQSLPAPSLSSTAVDVAAMRRTALSEAAARLALDHAQVHHSVLMRIAPDAFAADPAVLRYLLSVSAAVLGGREQGPAASGMRQVLAHCLDGKPGRMTTGRVIFDRRSTGLYLCRERRGLPSLRLPPGETSIWDGRFRISNGGTEAAMGEAVSATRADAIELFPHVPTSIALRAAQVMPSQRFSDGDPAGLTITPILAPFDRFLPQFDYKLAVMLGGLFGCNNLPPTPFGDYLRKR